MTLELSGVREQILAQEGHVLVTGGPGSGKTTIALLKAKRLCGSLDAGQGVLFLSFSKAAIRQILARSKQVLTRRERGLIEVKTYHLFCLEILRAHGRLLAGRPVRVLAPPQERLRKSDFDGDWESEQKRLASAESLFCFDQLARGAADLFEKCDALRQLYGDRYPLVIVDEFQDSDEDQWRLVRALAATTAVTCLADPEQRIFDYRPGVDPQRVNSVREVLHPAAYDLGADNHRSPDARILEVADRVLRNQGPLPAEADVKTVLYYANGFESTVHAGVVWTFSMLRKNGVESPCVAVLTRSNSFVAQLSAILLEAHVYRGTKLAPIPHDVMWDADLAAASAQVVGSILEWPTKIPRDAVSDTLRHIAQFFRIKNAERPAAAARKKAEQFLASAEAVRAGKPARIACARVLLTRREAGVTFRGEPIADWLLAREIVAGDSALSDVFRAVKMVRLFHASDALASSLAGLWLESGAYRDAAIVIGRALDRERLLGQERDHRGCVLMTTHKSKAKEFDGVVLVEGTFASPFFDEKREEAPFERSRRLLRVGISRARSLVTLVRPHGARPLVD
jgi:DNA helicase II / ATP-dependent DNA helicase PcrA